MLRIAKSKNFKIRFKMLIFCYCFILFKEKMLTEVEIEDGLEAPEKPSVYML